MDSCIVKFKFGCGIFQVSTNTDRMEYFVRSGFWVTESFDLARIDNKDEVWLIMPHMITSIEKVKDETDEEFY